MIEYVTITVLLSSVSAAHSWSICSGCLVTVCEYRMDAKINYHKSWYPTVMHIPYGSSCPPSIREKLNKRYFKKTPTPYKQWYHYNGK